MMLKVMLLFTLFCNQLSIASQKSEAFLITVKNMSISVVSPAKKDDLVSVIIKNETSIKVISELRTDQKVIERFVLLPYGQRSFIIETKNQKTFFYFPIAPPMQRVELKFNEKPYEIPEKS